MVLEQAQLCYGDGDWLLVICIIAAVVSACVPQGWWLKMGSVCNFLHRWNCTPSPGWTQDEVAILRLSLMKYGVGQWVKILDTGLLPGKMIQQLYGQTQRLLGQQSLAGKTSTSERGKIDGHLGQVSVGVGIGQLV